MMMLYVDRTILVCCFKRLPHVQRSRLNVE